MADTPSLGQRLTRRKPIEQFIIQSQSHGGELRRSITLFQLTMFGVGATIGTGIFFVLAEQVPPVGAFLNHESGWTLEVIAGNEKHVTRLRLHPPSPQEDPDD